MAKPKVGDVVEIKTSGGVAYALYTHDSSMYGALLRVWNKQFPVRPADISTLFSTSESFSCFFPLASAVKKKLVDIVGNVPVPSRLAAFPIFRAGMVDRDGKVPVWWLWDGEKEWRVGELTSEQRKLSIRSTWNASALREGIESDWTPEKDSS
jgi:hypothetical protein